MGREKARRTKIRRPCRSSAAIRFPFPSPRGRIRRSIPSFLRPETAHMPGRTLLVGLLLSFAAAATAAEPPQRPSPEENILRKAGVAVDVDGLLTFFRQRTPGDAERKRIGELIKRLGADDFDDRERAAKELRKVGGPATSLVRAAAASTRRRDRRPGQGASSRRSMRPRRCRRWRRRGCWPDAGPLPARAAGVPPLRRRRRRRGRGVGGASGADAGRQGRSRPGRGAGRFIAVQTRRRLLRPGPQRRRGPARRGAEAAQGRRRRGALAGGAGVSWSPTTGRPCRAWWSC